METQPTTEQAPVESPSLDDKLAAKFGFGPEESEQQTEQPEAPEATPEAASDDLRPEDIPADEPSDEWELTHNGQKRRVPKDEALKLAQQGFDYTQKTQALAEERKQVEAVKQALQARAQLQPQLVKAAAVIEALQAQIKPYAEADWVQIAQNDPAGYPQHHAAYQKLQMSLQQAVEQYKQVETQAQNIEHHISEQDRQAAARRLFEMVPQWTDEKRFQAERPKVIEYLKENGVTDEEISRLYDPRVVAMARKAWLYDEAMKNRGQAKNQIKQAPPVKSGPVQARPALVEQKRELIKQLHQAKDPERKKALLDDALAAKFRLK